MATPRLRVVADQLNADTDAFYDTLGRLIRYYQYRDRDRDCCGGLSVTEWYALDAVVRLQPPSIGELGHELRMDKSTASRVVALLEEGRLIEREPDPENHRVRKLRTTRKGSRLHASIVKTLKDEQKVLLAGLSHAERVRIIDLLGKVTSNASCRVPL